MDTSIMNMICSHVEGKSFEGKSILEIGSREVSGPSVRKLFQTINPKKYHGIDLVEGPGVDEVISAVDFCHKNKEKFDLLIVTEIFEHYKNWWELFDIMPELVADGGMILFSTPGEVFPFHPHEEDYWRIRPYDLKTIFGCMCHDLHCRKSFIIESTDKKHIFAKVIFEEDTFSQRKNMFYFMLKNMKMHNILLGDIVSPNEWITLQEGL